MKTAGKIIAACAAAITLSISCNPAPQFTPAEEMKGLIINEICPAIESSDESWVEIVNAGNAEINLYGLKLLVSDDFYFKFAAFEAPEFKLMPDERYVIVPDKLTFKLSTLEEVAIAAGDGTELACIDTKALASDKPEKGGSWSRIPDITGDIIATETATKGEKNYKFVPYKIPGVILNEVCPSQGWVEIYHNDVGSVKLDETTIVITNASGARETAYTFESASIAAKERIVVEAGIDGMKEIRIVSNEGIVADSLVVAKVAEGGTAAAGQSYAKLPDITGDWYVCSTPTKGEANKDISSDVTKLMLNEVSTEGWIEVYNPTVRTVSSAGVKVTVNGQAAGTLSGEMAPGSCVVINATVTEASDIKLETASGSKIDGFTKASVKDGMTPAANGSWSRIPDGSDWYTVKTASKNGTNYGIIKGNTNGIWYNQSNTPSLENNLVEFAKKGIGHVFLHEYAFKYYENLIPGILAKAEELGITIHIWMQCFWWNDGKGVNGWRSPVDDEHKCYDQALFDDILSEERAVKYVKAGVKGIHFDYIRYGGTAYKHDYPEVGVTGVGSINEFLRQADEKLRGINPKLIMSAALMNETGSEKYYGQHPEDMAKYLNILIPMIYRHQSSKFSDGTCLSKANWFAQHGAPAQCWAGTDTYEGNNGLSEKVIYNDCKVYGASNVKGVALFRHGIGGVPNLLDIKYNER